MDNTLLTEDRLETFQKLAKDLPEGAIAEVGVYKGGSLKYLSEIYPDRELFGFDTFEGLPEEKWNPEEVHKPGEFNDTSIYEVFDFIYMDNTDLNLRLIMGIFPDSAGPVEDEDFALVHVDTDFYETIVDAIDFFYPRLVEGGVMVFDDYKWPNCPGVEKALKEKFKESEIKQFTDYQAYIIKQENEI